MKHPLKFLAPDVALMQAVGSTVTRGKTTPSPERDSIQTLVATREGRQWRLAAFQNTRIRPMGRSVASFLIWAFSHLLWKVFGPKEETAHEEPFPGKDNTMNQTPTGKKALIVGCGIAGPVLAVFLKRAGIDAVVYEGRPEPNDEAGYFLNLAPNGVAVLGTLGIKDEVLAHSNPTASIVFQNHRGKQLGVLPETTILLKRGLLNKALRKDRVEGLDEEARRNGSRKAPANALTRGLRDLVLPFFLKMSVKNAGKAYSYKVDWDEKVAAV